PLLEKNAAAKSLMSRWTLPPPKTNFARKPSTRKRFLRPNRSKNSLKRNGFAAFFLPPSKSLELFAKRAANKKHLHSSSPTLSTAKKTLRTRTSPHGSKCPSLT